ncbi:MAG: VCBS repeat-containing protein, partial [Flavobacteriales bacterium]|nr:VCBS repeat-containing protein [Flavobacteriales bacterium]
MSKNPLLFALLVVQSVAVQAQWNLYFDGSVPVTRQGQTLDLAWAGGANFVQVSDIDLNGDGLKDLFLFDRSGNSFITLLNNGASGPMAYRISREYDDVHPFKELHDWVLFRDYNCDGKEDIF